MASIFSSLFGVGTQQQQQPQAATITTQELPKQVAPYYEKLLKEAEALYKQKMEAGAPTYEGKTIAGFTPEQEQLFTGLQSLAGTQAPKFAEAEALTRGTAAKITPEEVQEYMNPYQQAVVDIEKREAQKQYESTVVPQLAAQAAATGGFGGSRQAILEGMASEAQQRLLGDIQAKGSAQAYQDAMSNIAAQRQREGAAAAQLGQLAPAGFAAQAQELGAVGKVGDVKQQQAQLALDEAYKQFLQEQQFPSEALKEYQSYVQSFPNIPTQITRAPQPAQPSLANQLLGLGTAAVGTYGAFGGFSPGGLFGMKKAEVGGGIAGLPVVQAQEGKGIGQQILEGLKEGGLKIGRAAKRSVDDFADVLGPGRYRPLGTRTAEEIATEKLLSGDKDRGLFSRMLLRDPQEGINKIREDRGLASLDIGSTNQTINMQDQGTSDYNIDNIGAPTRQQEFTGDPDSSAYNITTPKPDADADRQALLAQFDNLSKEYTMPEDLKKGFEKIRTGVKTEVDEAQRDIEESQVAAKEELFTPLIGLGQAIATGKSTISGALTEAAKQAVDIRKKGKARTRELQKEKRKAQRELDKFDLDLAKYKDEKVTKQEEKYANRIKDKILLGVKLSEAEMKFVSLNIDAYNALSARIKAKNTGSSVKPGKISKTDLDNFGDLTSEVANFLTADENKLNTVNKINQGLANYNKQVPEQNRIDLLSDKDVKKTLSKLKSNTSFLNSFGNQYNFYKAREEEQGRVPDSPDEALRNFIPQYIIQNPSIISTNVPFIPGI
jgi:hypothetical protein